MSLQRYGKILIYANLCVKKMYVPTKRLPILATFELYSCCYAIYALICINVSLLVLHQRRDRSLGSKRYRSIGWDLV